MASRRDKWIRHLLSVTEKGMEAFRSGIGRDQNPYRITTYSGGNINRQRRQAWAEGWDYARQQEAER